MKFKNKRRIARVTKKARQVSGKVRRWLLDKFKKDFIRRQLDCRVGECRQCGKCCSLVYRCPFLKKVGDKQLCRIYEYRPAQCRHFPIDKRDLKEAGTTCGYSFIHKKDLKEYQKNNPPKSKKKDREKKDGDQA